LGLVFSKYGWIFKVGDPQKKTGGKRIAQKLKETENWKGNWTTQQPERGVLGEVKNSKFIPHENWSKWKRRSKREFYQGKSIGKERDFKKQAGGGEE